MTILVTGATGFLGGAVVHRLQHRGMGAVLATGRDRGAGERLAAQGVAFRVAHLEREADVAALFGGALGSIEAVIHCAARSAPWGADGEFEAANVTATRHLTAAARAARVARFVHVSTPALYFDGTDRRDVREDAPLARPTNPYVRTKLAAEGVVDRAVADGLPAVTLRPRALFGPGDTTIFPRLLRALARGRLPVIGGGTNRVDLTFVDNAADAAILALGAGSHVVGRKYNVTNGEPVPLWPLIARLARELGHPPPQRRVSRVAARRLATALELAHRVLRLRREPLLTRYTVDLLASDTTLDIAAARRDLGYAPEVTVEEGVRRFLAWLAEGRG